MQAKRGHCGATLHAWCCKRVVWIVRMASTVVATGRHGQDIMSPAETRAQSQCSYGHSPRVLRNTFVGDWKLVWINVVPAPYASSLHGQFLSLSESEDPYQILASLRMGTHSALTWFLYK